MLLCNFKAPSGDPSSLYTELQSRFGDDAATRIWNYIRSQEFGNKFLEGEVFDNVIEENKDEEGKQDMPGLIFQFDLMYGIPLDSNGEPTIDWVLKNVDVPKETKPPKKTRKSKKDKEETPITPEVKPTKSVLTIADFGSGSKTTRIPYEKALQTVSDFYESARNNPTQKFDASGFKVQDIKKPTSNGFSPVELANLFASYPIPPNVKFDEWFSSLIINTATFQTNNWDTREVPFLKYNEAMLADVLDNYFIPIKNADGTKTGKRFTSEQQVAGVDTLVTLVWDTYRKDPNVRVRSLLQRSGTIYNQLQSYSVRYTEFPERLASWISPGQAKAWGDNIRTVLNSWEDFVGKALYKLADYGLAVSGKSTIETMQSLVGTDVTNDSPDEALQGEEGKGLKDWSDSSFELDPKDTAHTRIKLFLASIRDVTVGTEREPRKLKLAFNDPALRERILGKNPILGTKTQTIRTAAQAEDLQINPGGQYITTIDDAGEKIKFRVFAEKKLTADDLQDEDIQSIGEEEKIDPQVGDVLLRLERWTPREGMLIPKENFLGFANLVDFETLFQNLLETLNDVPNTIEDNINKLKEEGQNYKPVFLEVARMLKAQREDIQREFVKVMSKQYQEFSILLYSKRRGGLLDATEINANRGSAINTIIDQWKENQKNAEIVLRTPDGNLIINDTTAQEFMGRLRDINETYNLREFPTTDVLRDFALDILETNGIILPDKAFERLFTKTSQVTKGTSVAGGIHDQFKINADSTPRGIFSAMVMKLAGVTQEESRNEGDSTYLLNNNPLYTENTSVRVLAQLAYKYSPRTASGSHRNSQGKNIYAFGQNSFLSSTIKRLHTDPEFIKNLGDTFLGNRSWLLQRLITNSEALDKFQIRYVDGLKQAYRRNARGIERTDMSTREQLLFSMMQFQNQKSLYGNFLSLTHSDKKTTPLFMGIEKFTPDSQDAQQAVYDTFLGEYERMKYWYVETQQNHNPTLNDSFNKGGGLYYFIPELNYDFLTKELRSNNISQDEMSLLWTAKGVPNTRTSITALKDFVLKVFNTYYLQPEIEKLTRIMKNEGFYKQGLIDYSYLKKNIGKVGIKMIGQGGKRIYLSQDETQFFTEEQALERFMPWAAKDYILNSFLVESALSTMFYGDPALAYKGKSSIDYIQVTETMIEYQKRLAKDIAPGQDPTWDTPNETYQTLTIQDDERLHAYLQDLPKYANKQINGTDAQELTTVREHLYVLKALGGAIPGANTIMTPKIYDEMIKIINEGLKRPDKYYEFTDPAHKDIVMQIMKPVSVSYDFDEVNGTAVVHYVKSSSMPLYPPMTKYFQLEDLRKAMEGDGTPDTHIPRANYISAKKMGAPAGKGVKIFDADGNINVDTKSPEWENAIQTLNREGLRIQQEVPYDETKEDITGSQMNKLFTEGINDLSFTLPGVEGQISGKDFKNIKEETRKRMVQLQLDDYLDKVGAIRVGDTIRIQDKSKLLSILEDEAVTRGYAPNDLLMLRRKVEDTLADGTKSIELAIPLFFNPSASKFESLMMSLIKKVGQIYLPGKSYIQASSAGFRFKEGKTFESLKNEDREGIVWIPGYDGSELRTMTKSTVVGENGKATEHTQPAQVLLPFNFLVQDKAGNSHPADIKRYITRDKKGKMILDTEKIPTDLLHMIMFRIPTQKQNSMLPMEVVGFLPQNMGDAIVVPAALTLQMGSDFDVDKLFGYRRPYKRSNGGFTSVSDTNSEMDQLQAKYFNIMWAVLTHPDMYDKVLEPLDKDDLKLESKRAAGQANKVSHFYSPTTQLRDFESQKDAKAMIGITSQFVTAAAWGENMHMFAGTYRQVEEGEERDFDVVFDEDGQPDINNYELKLEPDGVRFIVENGRKEEHAYWISKEGESMYFNEDTQTEEYRTKIEDIVTLQNELLDHAKNRTIDNLNINLHTVYAALAGVLMSSDSGAKPSWKHITLLLRQPSIMRLVSELQRSQDSLSEAFDPKLFKNTIANLLKEYIDDPLQLSRGVEPGALDIEKLKDNISFKNTPDQRYYQAQVLQIFDRLNDIGREMGFFQRVFNQDPKGPGKNMVTALRSLTDEDKVKNSPTIANGADLFTSEQGYIHTVELNTARDAYRDLLPYETLSETLTDLLTHTGRQQFSVDTIKDITDEFKSYVFSNTDLGLTDNSNRDRFRLLYGDTKTGEKALATRVWEAQNSWGQNNYFLRRLSPKQAETVNEPSYIFYQKAQTSSLDDQENSAALLQILTSTEPEQKKLGEDLVRYAYVSGGISGSFSFIRYIPTDYLIALPFASKLRETIKNLSDPNSHADYDDFNEQWIRHNPTMIKKVGPAMIQDKETPGEKFKLQTPNQKNGVFSIAPLNDDRVPIYPKYLSFYDTDDNTWKLYKQNKSLSREYTRIDTLGNSYISEYTFQAGYQPSIFIENKALIKHDESGVKSDISIREKDLINSNNKWTVLGISGTLRTSAEVTQLLSSMSKNNSLTADIKAVAAELSQIVNKTQRTAPLNLKIGQLEREGSSGNFDPNTGTITISPEDSDNANDIARVIIHEALHGVTTMYLNQSKTFQEQFPEVYKALEQVREVREEAQTAILKEIEDKGYTLDEVKDTIAKGKTDDLLLHKLAVIYYGTINDDEFISNIFESKPFQEFLNSKKSTLDNTSIMGKIGDFIKNFLIQLGKVLGVKINANSMLQVGLERSYNLIQAIDDNSEKIGKPINVIKALSDTYFQGKVSPQMEWTVMDSKKAEEIAKDIEDEFPYLKVELNYKEDGSATVDVEFKQHYKIDLRPEDYKASTNPIDNLYGKVQEQMQDIRASIAKNKKSADVLRQNQLLVELKILANDLKATQDLDKAKDLANYQLDWAQNVKDKFDEGKPVSINQIMTAYRLINIWSGVLDLIYNSDSTLNDIEYDPEFVTIQGEAERLRTSFLSRIMKDTLNDLSQNGITDEDYKNIKDMPAGEARFLDIARAESKITQEVGLIIQNTHRSYLEKGQRLLRELEDFEKEAHKLAKARGMKPQDFYENFMQDDDNWGLVTRFTSTFYRWKSRQRSKLNEKLDKIEATIPDKGQRTQAIRSAWSAYWRNIDKNAGFIDIRVLLDEKTGEMQNTTASAKYHQEMVEEYGKEVAAELVKEAHEKYNSYLDEQEDVFDMYDTQVTEGMMSEEEARDAKSAWTLQYSPADKLTSRTVPGRNYTSMSERYLVMVPHNDATDLNKNSYFDDKYAKIQADAEMKAFYEKIQDFMDRFTGNLPYYLDHKLGPNFLPAIQKELLGSITDVPKYLLKAPKELTNMLTASSYEEFMQARARKDIPILYMDNPFDGLTKPAPDAPEEAWKTYNKSKKQKLQSYTRDLPRILELFGLMSTHYQTFSEARDAIDLGHEVIRKADQDLQKGNKQVVKDGKTVTIQSNLSNTLGALEYTKDVLMFRRSRNLEGKITEIAKRKDKKETVTKLREIHAKQIELERKLKNNEIGLDDYTIEDQNLEAEKKKYEIRKLYASKVGDTLITWTQLKSLSYNPLSAINNVAFGLISATIFANQNQEYGWKEFRKGLSLMMNATGRSIGLARITGNKSAMNTTAEKILNIMDRMNIMGELTETAYAKSNLPEKRSALRTVTSPYQMLRTGDYFVKGINTVATLLKEKVTVDGQEVSVWDAIDNNGNWKYPDMPEWQSEDPLEQTNWNKLRNKIVGVNKIIMGNQDKSSPMWAKKSILFRLVGQFRLSWLAEGIASRFESGRDDIQLGREKRGRYITYADLGAKGSLQVLGRQLLSSMPGVKVDPYKNRKLKNGKDMSDTDKANMRANLTEIMWFTLLFGAAKVIVALATGDPDDDKKKWLWLMANMATRTYQDVGLYSQPTILDSILGTPAPALGTIRDTMRFLQASLKYATNDDYEFKQWLLAFTRMGLPIPQSTLINRFNTMTSKDISTIQR